MRPLYLIPWLVLFAATAAFAQKQAHIRASSSSAPVANLQSVQVQAEMPGPQLWKVSKGGHVMYVLGFPRFLPPRQRWNAAEVESIIASSQRVLTETQLKIPVCAEVSETVLALPPLFGLYMVKNDLGLESLPTADVRKNPRHASLRESLAAGDYARWKALREKYLGGDTEVENRRPIFAAAELLGKAIDNGRFDLGVSDSVRNLAGKHRVKVKAVIGEMPFDRPEAVAAAIESLRMDDRPCFRATLDMVEQGLGNLVERARAWAVGDLPGLRQLLAGDPGAACAAAARKAGLVEKLGWDIQQMMDATWMAAVDESMSLHAQTFALLPVEEALSPTGVLRKLSERGYRVTAPDEGDAASSH